MSMSPAHDNLLTPAVALCSLSDMTQAQPFFQELVSLLPDLRLYATDGTATRLNAFLPHKHDGQGRVASLNSYISPHSGTLDIVKTLDTRIFSGILIDRENEAHKAAAEEQKLILFDMLIVNFYTAKIDIGGPAMLRAAAKNARYVTAIVGAPAQYEALLTELRTHDGKIGYAFRRQCALNTMDSIGEYVGACKQHIPTSIA